MVEREQIYNANIKDNKTTFHDTMKVIHIDEKWFYLAKNSRRYYLGVQESEPHWTMRSKRNCTKVMFLAAVARPRWNTTTNKQFDGKIGIWSFTIWKLPKETVVIAQLVPLS